MMRHQTLSGFALHQRRYRERSHILHFFSQEVGRVDGVLRQSPPALYHLSNLQANGKSALKNFSQLDVQGQPFYLQHKALFAGFYLNELLLRLLPLEEPMPSTYQAYVVALQQLKALPSSDPQELQLKLLLRQFEQCFLDELGYQIDFGHDGYGHSIQETQYYHFALPEGFLPQSQPKGFLGRDLLQLAQNAQINSRNMTLVAKLYRMLFSSLLGNKPLKSRQLWVSQQQQT
jgi:DNA repair protein RecO (recombination protein O)